MKPRPALAIALLVSLLSAAPAHAVLPAGNVVQNGDAEAGPGATNETDVPAVPAWQTLPNFTAVVYGTTTFPSVAHSAQIGGGANFFAGGPDNGFGDVSIAYQEIDLSGGVPELDGDNVRATLSADVGGYGETGDSASVSVLFGGQDGQSVTGALGLEPATPQDRGGETKLIRRSACTTLSPGTRTAFVSIAMQRVQGPYNDGYADNVSLTFSTQPCPPAPDAPLQPPAPPQVGVSGNADAVSGRVFVRRPGSDDFQELRNERSIPIGAEVDARRGVVQLETAADSTGGVQIGKFYQGSFVMTQTMGARPITDLVLTGGRIDKCPAAGSRVTAAQRRPARRLWGDARGRFRTRGRYASATVRGTRWSLRDTCTATKVTVARGSVVVRDFSKRRNIRLRAPRSYTARARQAR